MNNFEFADNPTEALLAAFRRHSSGVVVITGTTDHQTPFGFTATSITSLGATPPLVMFSVARGASSFRSMQVGHAIAVHTLGAKNVDLAKRMAGPKELRFDSSDWKLGPDGVPIFDCATAILVCKIRLVVDVEANAVVIADVVNGSIGEADSPLVYYQRAYQTATELN